MISKVLLILIGISVIVILFGPRPKIGEISLKKLPTDFEQSLKESEATFSDLTQGAEKTITWANPQKGKTNFSVIYVHGFSATRRDLHPVIGDFAKSLQANLFETRLTGHGQKGEQLGAARATDWIADMEEAVLIGKQLGNQVIVVGMSTGATLATWAAYRHKDIFSTILLSPNFYPKNPSSSLLIGPWGRQIGQLALGSHREWKGDNADHEKFWTTKYPVEALVQMMLLVTHVNTLDLREVKSPVKVIYTRHDEVIDTDILKKKYGEFGSLKKEIVDLRVANRHELAGDILAPQANHSLLREMIAFVKTQKQVR